MKTYPHIHYAQRPPSYWNHAEVLSVLLRDVKGAARRKMIRARWAEGRLDELSEELLQDTLTEETRVRFGQIHPAFMGGEYLPDTTADEVEVARIELQSTTCDVISIRARRAPTGIRYSIVDEYETEFAQPFETSPQPLTLRQLIAFIDGSSEGVADGGLALAYNEINADQTGDRTAFRHFTTVSSEFYPQLATHYERVFEDWVAHGLPDSRQGSKH